MPKYMIITTVFLFWAFYEMSGGADFEPPIRQVADVEMTPEVSEVPQPVPLAASDPAPEPVTEPQDEVILASYEDEPLSIASVVPTIALEAVASPAFIAPDPIDIRFVAGDWVNMRDGPSTAYEVLDTLPRGTEAEVIEVNGAGWAQIRLIDSGKTGWMAERLLSAQ